MAQKKEEREFFPSTHQPLKHPLAILALVPKDAALFPAGAIAGAAAKTIMAPLDCIKLLVQVHALLKIVGNNIDWRGRRDQRVLERQPSSGNTDYTLQCSAAVHL